MPAQIKAELKTLKTLATPDGIAAYPKLVKPVDPFDSGRPKFEITVFFDKNPTFTKFAKLLAELQHEYRVSINKAKAGAKKMAAASCIKLSEQKHADKLGIKVGTPYIQFSTRGTDDGGADLEPIPVFGPDGRPTGTRVYGTDIVSIETRVVGWKTGQGNGVKCYLVGVQLLQSNWSSTAGSSFGVRDEYITDQDSDDADADAPDETGLEDEDVNLDDEYDASGGMV